jgi:hypothetical protein
MWGSWLENNWLAHEEDILDIFTAASRFVGVLLTQRRDK